jgi:hypothetical protein
VQSIIAATMQPWKVFNNSRKFAAMNAVNERSAASHSMTLFRIEPKGSFEKALYLNALFYFRAQVRDPQPALRDFIVATS